MVGSLIQLDVQVEKGKPFPLGATVVSRGVNFALYSQHATDVSLCLFEPGSRTPCMEFKLDPKLNRTGNVWHLTLRDLPENYRYAYRVDGPQDLQKGLAFDPTKYLLDPYAKAVDSRASWADPKEDTYHPLGCIVGEDCFDWQGVQAPGLALKDLVIYEMHVRGFTSHPSSLCDAPGTFSALTEKLPYLKELGVNAIELMPIQEFNELEYPRTSPETGEKLVNYWGYSTVNFFSLMGRYGKSNEAAELIDEFKTLVRECHRNDIEVILDVVFNHTAEGNLQGPTLSFRGIDQPDYYILDQDGQPMNFSGCGNTIDPNSPAVRNLILDSLRYWVSEMRVDGFRFDLASALGRDRDGTPMGFSPLIDQISQDPLLADVKLIAEAWDAAGLYQVGAFFPEYGRWVEWNGHYRDDVRRFMKGTDNCAGNFATRMTGSEDLYGNGRRPYHSLNFITAHDGFTLRDLVSYNQKRNLANGEGNADGCNENESWNCGAEGETDDQAVLYLRERQERNLLLSLFAAIGVPMLHMGDEYGHTKKGNNNTWCQDNALNWFQWDQLHKNKELWRFCKLLIQFRHDHPVLKRDHFVRESDVVWFDEHGETPDWEPEQRFIAWELPDHSDQHNLYLAFNAHYEDKQVLLPKPPPGRNWYWVANTAMNSPYDFRDEETLEPVIEKSITMPRHSAVLLEARARAVRSS